MAGMQTRPSSPSLLLLLFLYLNLNLNLALNQEGLLLLSVKQSLSDPTGFLSGWSDRTGAPTPCNWTGVACNARNSVVSIVLSGAPLAGPFPIDLCRLPSLAKLSLDNDEINSSLPLSISDCRSLVYLDLSGNFIVGPLPPTLADIRSLRELRLESNNFSGAIPAEFGYFQRLEALQLTENLLTGTIPAFLANVTTLKKLFLAYNPLGGELPWEIGNMTKLEELWVSNCGLTGTIPESYGRLSRLKNLDVSGNKLSGSLNVLMKLKNIVQMELFNNTFSGNLLANGWSNLTRLRRIDASMNRFTGNLPNELCELPLESLNLFENHLEGVIPDSIAKSPNLYELKLFGNKFSGTLPQDLGKNSALKTLDVTGCNLTGEIPPFLCRHGALKEMILLRNSFYGTIPQQLAKCWTLQRVRMALNRLSGEIPAEFWGLPEVYLLELSGNSFNGTIASSIKGAKSLTDFDISKNKFSGNIPSEFGLLDSLVEFTVNNNMFSGEIPSSLTHLRHLTRLEFHNNRFSGGIPTGIQNLKVLNDLNLANNTLSGPIIDEIGNLPVLNYLDLSNNHFSGSIPLSLQNLKLNQLNLSNNMLAGVIPPLFAGEFFRDSFLGNPGLCLETSGLCRPSKGHEPPVFSWFIMFVLIFFGITTAAGIVWFMIKYKKINRLKKSVPLVKWTSFHKLEFSETEIAKCLKEANMIGMGASGKVYKVILSNGETVAVKKMHDRLTFDDTSNVDEFHVEVETLGSIRHKNIVKLWCCCDMGACKLLVYEYMPNGSLGDALHKNNGKILTWPKRFSIALDAAEGLSYLHHDAVPPIVHRDVKSNNILLDEDFGAKIADFGVAKIVKTIDNGFQSMSAITGSCGYIAPEYAYTLRVNEKSDIYSFGIVLMELVTGKPPVSPEYGEKDLSAWVRSGKVLVLDPKLDPRFEEHAGKVLELGLLCTSQIPANRPSMRRVVGMLQQLGAEMPPAVVEEKEA
ncbi:receptor-like protein kinase HSL1 [Andrographis paniculata]|uniref:receptor-like protein kinase HSL1 n=1 Tax=Andrographis paniculata TaxID=175694 RepID=UPI0021E93554|nr:receptor-like protein kinase HSL1 [Andrographis paniculata]